MLSFSTEQHAIEGAITFDDVDWIWASPGAAHDRAAGGLADCDHARQRLPTQKTSSTNCARWMWRRMLHRTPAAVASAI